VTDTCPAAGYRSAMAFRSCAVCGRLLVGRVLLSAWQRPFCDRHGGDPSCSGCGLSVPVAVGSPRSVPLCAECRPVAVVDQDGVRRVLPGIKQDLQDLGVALRSRTKVKLVSREQLTDRHLGRGGEVNGLTLLGGQAAVEILVREGLTHSQFGVVVAHETMHAFLFERGFRNLDGPSEEGMCEVLAYEWVRRRPGPLDRYEALRMNQNPDAVYGGGFRAAKAAVDRLGVMETLRVLRRTGRIPGGP
jgi:hypothetical protein